MSEADRRRVWELGWDGHARAQRRRLADLPLAEKLRWLEETHVLIRHLERQRRASPSLPASTDDATPPGTSKRSRRSR